MRKTRRDDAHGARRVRGALRPRLAHNLAQRRGALSITQAQLAERIGVSSETIARFERGVYAPSLQKLERLAEALRIPASELLAEDRTLVRSDHENRLLACFVGLANEDQDFLTEVIESCSAHLRRRGRR